MDEHGCIGAAAAAAPAGRSTAHTGATRSRAGPLSEEPRRVCGAAGSASPSLEHPGRARRGGERECGGGQRSDGDGMKPCTYDPHENSRQRSSKIKPNPEGQSITSEPNQKCDDDDFDDTDRVKQTEGNRGRIVCR